MRKSVLLTCSLVMAVFVMAGCFAKLPKETLTKIDGEITCEFRVGQNPRFIGSAVETDAVFDKEKFIKLFNEYAKYDPKHLKYHLNECDLKINSGDPLQQEKLVEIVRIAQPDMIITHYPDDYMPDHCETSKLVFYASFASSCPNYRTQSSCFEPVVPIYYMETAGAMGFIPEEYVDISDYLDLKLEAIRCHKSQAQWLDDHDGFNMEEFATVVGRLRGIQCNRQYAEGFCKCNVWPRAQAERVLP